MERNSKYIQVICIAILLFLHTSIAFSQSCSCQNELKFVIDYYEQNLPGYSDNVTSANQKEYEQFKLELLDNAGKVCEQKKDCFKLLTYYVEYFKDNHSGISYNEPVQVNEKDKKAVKKFLKTDLFKKQEILYLPTNEGGNHGIDQLENEYVNKDGTYTVRIVKSKNAIRDYVGVITTSKTPLWVKDQVKFELKQKTENTFDMFLYMRNHTLMFYKNVVFKNGVLGGDWFNLQIKEKRNYSTETPGKLTFKELDEKTNYMYLPTFSGNWIAKLDSFYRANDPNVKSKPFLIIDVRNNGGGSDMNVQFLLHYIYTKPFYGDTVSLYVTKENIRKSQQWYDENKNDTVNYDKDFLNYTLQEIELMKKASDRSFIPRYNGELIVLDSVLENPQKVVILMNRHCASSCEALLFMGLESDKTILAGENSGGYVGYGEISTVETPNFHFSLGCTMTRYEKQRAFEEKGIPPAIYLNNESDWVEQGMELLKR